MGLAITRGTDAAATLGVLAPAPRAATAAAPPAAAAGAPPVARAMRNPASTRLLRPSRAAPPASSSGELAARNSRQMVISSAIGLEPALPAKPHASLRASVTTTWAYSVVQNLACQRSARPRVWGNAQHIC